MNIKIKAGLDVASVVIVAIIGVAGIRYILTTIAEQIGVANTINGLMVAGMIGLAYFILGIFYDIRVSQLKYKAKLEEMTKK